MGKGCFLPKNFRLDRDGCRYEHVCMTNVIEAIGIRKSFAKAKPLGEFLLHPFRQGELVHALRGVDLSVAEGEILSLLGPNGAGKTTLLKIFSCLILPNEGQALMAGTATYSAYAPSRWTPRMRVCGHR